MENLTPTLYLTLLERTERRILHCTEPSLSAMSIFQYFEYPSGLGRVLIFLECVEGEGDYPRQRLAA